MTKYVFDIPGFKGYQLDLVTQYIYSKFGSKITTRKDSGGKNIVSMTRTNGIRTAKRVKTLVELVLQFQLEREATEVVEVRIRYGSHYLYHIGRLGMDTEDGYIGVTNNPKKRFGQHRREDTAVTPYFKLYNDLTLTLIFEGDRKDCLKKEKELRPEPNIGWNIDQGGGGRWNKRRNL